MKVKAQTPNKTPQKAKASKKTKTPPNTPMPKQSPKNVETSNKQVTTKYKIVKVIIPNLPNAADVLLDLMKHCETIKIAYRGLSVILGLAPDKADKIVKQLSALEYDGHKLKIQAWDSGPIEPLIKRIHLSVANLEEKLKTHYNASKVVSHNTHTRVMYLLHFSSKGEADAAMNKLIKIEGKKFYPLDYQIRNVPEKRIAPQSGSPAKKLKNEEAKSQVRVEEDEEEDDSEDEEEDDESEDEDDESGDEEEDDEDDDDE